MTTETHKLGPSVRVQIIDGIPQCTVTGCGPMAEMEPNLWTCLRCKERIDALRDAVVASFDATVMRFSWGQQ